MSNAVRTLRHGTLKLKDGTGTPVAKTMQLLDGGLSAQIRNRPIQEILDRGTIDQVILMDDQLLPFSFSLQVAELYGEASATAGASLTPWEWFTATAGATAVGNNTLSAALTSTDATQGVPILINIELTLVRPDDTTEAEVWTWSKCWVETCDFAEGYGSKIDVAGKAQAFSVTSTVTG